MNTVHVEFSNGGLAAVLRARRGYWEEDLDSSREELVCRGFVPLLLDEPLLSDNGDELFIWLKSGDPNARRAAVSLAARLADSSSVVAGP